MFNFRRIAVGLPVDALQEALARQPALWGELTFRQDHPLSPHRDTEAIFLTWCDPITVEGIFTDLRAVPYPALARLPEAADLINDAAAIIDAKAIGRTMLVALQAGGVIAPHIDEGAYADHYERFHLVVTSAPGNIFECGGETVHMQPGELWCFNHKRLHSVSNFSTTPRVHLIIDAVAPGYRVERERAAA